MVVSAATCLKLCKISISQQPMDCFQRGVQSVLKHIQILIWHYQLIQLVPLLCSFLTSSAISCKLLKDTFFGSPLDIVSICIDIQPKDSYQSIKNPKTIQVMLKLHHRKRRKADGLKGTVAKGYYELIL